MTGAQGEKRALELGGARAKAGLVATAGPVVVREPGRIVIPLDQHGPHLEWPLHWLGVIARSLPLDTIVLGIQRDPQRFSDLMLLQSAEFPIPRKGAYIPEATMLIERIATPTGYRDELVGIEWPRREEED